MDGMKSAIFDEYLKKLDSYDKHMPLKEEYADYLEKFHMLADKIKQYTHMGPDGKYPVLTKDDYEEFQKLYEKTIMSGEYFQQEALGMNDQYHLKAKVHLVDYLKYILSADLKVLTRHVGKEDKTLPAIIDESRGYEIEISEDQLDSVGGALSHRIPLHFQDKSGEKIEGFFTETEVYNGNDAVFRAKNNFLKHFPGEEKVVFYLMKNRDIINGFCSTFQAEKTLFKLINGKNLKGNEFNQILKPYLEEFAESIININDRIEFREAINRMQDKEDYLKYMVDFFKEYAAAVNERAIMDKAKIFDGSYIAERNAAMSSVAGLLGIDNIIAKSVQMTVNQNGVKKTGVFMEKAEGYDLNHLDKDSPMLKIGCNKEGKKVGNGISPMALKQISDLQVLDYICGNIDRHRCNLTYKVEYVDDCYTIVGVQGFDNDCSFGMLEEKLGADFKNMVHVSDFLYMSNDLKNRILSTTPSMLRTMLNQYKIKDVQIEAAISRFKTVQNHIVSQMKYQRNGLNAQLRFMKDSDWKLINFNNIKDFRDVSNGNTYMDYLPESAELAKAFFKEDKQIAKARQVAEQKCPVLFPKKKAFQYYGARRFNEGKSVFVKENQDLLTLLVQKVQVNHYWNGKKEYDNMEKALNEVTAIAANITEESDIFQWRRLHEAYKKLDQMTDTYLLRKEKQKLDKVEAGGDVSETARNRMRVAEDISDYVKNRLGNIKQIEKDKLEADRKMVYSADDLSKEIEELKVSIKDHPFDAETYSKYKALDLMHDYKMKNKNAVITKTDIDENMESIFTSSAMKQVEKKLHRKNVTVMDCDNEFKTAILKADEEKMKQAEAQVKESTMQPVL